MFEILQIIVGASISIIFVIYLEKKKLPDFEVSIETPIVDLKYEGRPANRHRALRIIVENKSLNAFFGLFLSRSAACNCKAFITFHHLDGQNIFGRTMNGRWANTPQPIPLRGTCGDQEVILFDDMRMTPTSYVDIYAGDSAVLDVAARFDNDSDAYGWSNDSYFSNPVWRPSQWKLPSNRYLIKVDIIASNSKYSLLYRLINDVSIDDFRLELVQVEFPQYGGQYLSNNLKY